MDNLCSSFALQQGDELVLQNNIVPTFATNNHSYASLDRSEGDFSGSNSDDQKCKGLSKPSAFRGDEGNTSDGKKRKIMLRDIERQRRQEMANLYASLRALLPLEYLKGKRSVTDLIHLAANYIKLQEKNIEELKTKRDTLKNFKAADDFESTNQSSSCSNPLPIDIMVRSGLDGIEIVISVDHLNTDSFRLSRVLNVVIAEGLKVLNCFCMKVNCRILHTILTEVGHPGDVDIFKLQQKLTDVANSSSLPEASSRMN